MKITKNLLFLLLVISNITMILIILNMKNDKKNDYTATTYTSNNVLVVNENYQTRNVAKADRYLQLEDMDVYTNLSNMRTVSVDQINYIIDYWDSLYELNSPFKDQGQAFIDASRESGLDPVYILAHAALESAWGTSNIAQDKYNYFGIGAFDDDPYENSFVVGSDTYSGIVLGAKWISDNYYKKGQTSLYSMRYNHGENEYCTSFTWMYEISDIIRTSYSLI